MTRGCEKMMSALPSYRVGKTFSAMIVIGGIILSRPSEKKDTPLSKIPVPDTSRGMAVQKKWDIISLADPSELDNYLPFIRSSYKAALKTRKPEG